ncbi:MAG: hypothetical protein ACYTFK_12730 [Planctomycetota bacterium]|jgi:hypothetical protein
MTFDELQEKWQSHKELTTITVDTDMLLKEVRRNKSSFEASIFWRDVREVGASFFVAVYFFYYGLKDKTWSAVTLGVFALSVGLFMLADRALQKKKRPDHSNTLAGCIESSLAQVAHQIWLLKNVLWWYMLPLLIGVAIFTGHIAWMLRDAGIPFWTHIFKSIGIWALITWGIYKLNQYAVRKILQPRHQELENLLNSLEDVNE